MTYWQSEQSRPRNSSLYNNAFYECQALEPSRVALEIGGPGVETLRRSSKLMLDATKRRLEKEISGNGDLLQYGSTQGDPDYRRNLARFLTEQYNGNVDVDSLMTTSGASTGLPLVASTFFKSDDIVFVEDPTYYYANEIFCVDLGLKSVPIPYCLEDGIDLTTLTKEIQLRKPKNFKPTAERPFWALMYAITVFHNPTGMCYSKEKCERLIRIARENNLLVVCDDVYNFLCYEKNGDTFEKAPPRLLQYDRKSDADYFGNVVSNGSFSKILGPGLRVGWIEAPKAVISKLKRKGSVMSGGGMSHYTSGIVANCIQTEMFREYISTVKQDAKMKLDAVVNVFSKHCPKDVKYVIPKGGYFIWMELPSSVDVVELSEYCKNTYNISFHHGFKCSTVGNFRNCIRICFIYFTAEELVKAITKLLDEIASRLKA